jgi:hypothetical protein
MIGVFFTLIQPTLLGNADNAIIVNPLSTPSHITPE